MSSCPTGKSSWPEVVGRKGEDAASLIEKQNPGVDAVILKDGTPISKEYRCERVLVWVNDAGIVVRTPNIGKSSWPELVTADGEEAAAVIERENGNVNAIVVRDGTSVTDDFRCDRVWVWVNRHGAVVRVPTIG